MDPVCLMILLMMIETNGGQSGKFPRASTGQNPWTASQSYAGLSATTLRQARSYELNDLTTFIEALSSFYLRQQAYAANGKRESPDKTRGGTGRRTGRKDNTTHEWL